jgi:hypothetical protein
MKLSNIIHEEIKKILNEAYSFENKNFQFRQEIKNSSFYNFEGFSSDFDMNILESDIFITWHIAFWLNEAGIQNFIVEADSLEGTYKLMYLNKHSDEVEQENDKDIAEFPWKFKITEANLHLGKTLYIKLLAFDFKTKICTITFFDEEG